MTDTVCTRNAPPLPETRRRPRRWFPRPALSLLLPLTCTLPLGLIALAAPAGAGELLLQAELAPWNRALYVPVWVEFEVGRRGAEESHLFAGETPERLYNSFQLSPERGALDGELERALFPASTYVGRSCPPQEYAQLAEVVPRRRGTDRGAVPVDEGERRRAWVAFEVTSDTEGLTARYHCFDAAYELTESDLPPAEGDRPPPAEEAVEGGGAEGGSEGEAESGSISTLPAGNGARRKPRAADAPQGG